MISFQLYASEEYFLEWQLFQAVSKGVYTDVKHLLSAGADINIANLNGLTPLSVSCAQGHKDVAALLIRAKADINKADLDGKTPLFWAYLKGHIDVAALLVEAGADVNKATGHGLIPLHMTSSKAHIDIAALLVKAGADLNKATGHGLTPLSVACRWMNKDIAVLLSKHGADSLGKRIIDELPEESKLLAERCNFFINKRTALLKQLLDAPKESDFLQGVLLPKVLQKLIIQDMLDHKNCDLQ